jgi:hypothetical protein
MNPPEPADNDLPEPQDPDFIQVTNVLRTAAEKARDEKANALQEWSEEQSDEEILDEFGVDMDVLREDP